MIDILRRHIGVWRVAHVPTSAQAKLLHDIELCRTAELGGHLQVCPSCGHELPLYNSCRNRCCPNCQAIAQARWIAAREEVILPIGHHHLVFTLPAEFRALALCHPVAIYDLLFNSAHATLTTLAKDMLGGQLGVTAVLHTWTRDLSFHPHIHCIVTAGALSADGQRCVPRPRSLFPAQRMKAVFRGRILAGLEDLVRHEVISTHEHTALLLSLPDQKKWVVYSKRPFGRSKYVLKYLGRYTHRIAISDARLISANDVAVCFATKDGKRTTLTSAAFVERFMRHVLPAGFHKIRHYGLYAPGLACRRRELARALLEPKAAESPAEHAKTTSSAEPWDELLLRLTGKDPLLCPRCGKARMRRFVLPAVPRATGPPRSPA